jgi:hypothetical protein
MKNLPIPIIVPYGYKLRISQPFGSTGDVEWYKNNGLNIPFHNGVDIVVDNDDPRLTYGSACFCPFPKGWTVKKTFDSAMSTKGNGVTLESDTFVEDGIEKKVQIVLWHLSSLTDGTQLVYKNIVGYVGNSGLVHPAPSTACPFCGSHLHLMLYEFHKTSTGMFMLQNTGNGVGGAVDPMTRFSLSVAEYGEDTNVSFDTAPLKWAMAKLGLVEVYQKIMYLLSIIKIK